MHAAARASDSGAPLASLLPSWELHLNEGGKSDKTIDSYLRSVRMLTTFLAASGMLDDTELTGAPEIRAFIVGETARTSAVSAQLHYRNLRVYFSWLEREGERQAPNPMLRVDKPKAAEKVKPFFTEAEQSKLLKVTAGQDFESRRDHAMLRVLIDCGVRVTGLADLRYDPADYDLNDVFLAHKRLRVRLKGGRETWVPLGKKAAAAIDRYIRTRARSPHADSPWLWLGTRGRGVSHMTSSGIRVMLARRGVQAGVQGVNPHRFRHTFADAWLAGGGNVDDLMSVAGWTTYDMPLKYARGRGIARAAAAHARLSPGDRL
jgi:site-specific recombinase XerD